MTAEHAANRQQADAHERGKRKRELSTFWALVAAAGAAIVTLIVSHCDNRAIISESRRIAAQQHADTIAALSKTDAAIASTKIHLLVLLSNKPLPLPGAFPARGSMYNFLILSRRLSKSTKVAPSAFP